MNWIVKRVDPVVTMGAGSSKERPPVRRVLLSVNVGRIGDGDSSDFFTSGHVRDLVEGNLKRDLSIALQNHLRSGDTMEIGHVGLLGSCNGVSLAIAFTYGAERYFSNGQDLFRPPMLCFASKSDKEKAVDLARRLYVATVLAEVDPKEPYFRY